MELKGFDEDEPSEGGRKLESAEMLKKRPSDEEVCKRDETEPLQVPVEKNPSEEFASYFGLMELSELDSVEVFVLVLSRNLLKNATFIGCREVGQFFSNHRKQTKPLLQR